jgi:hypothetical protein
MRIDVTQEDIDAALAAKDMDGWENVSMCPVARATQRAFDDPKATSGFSYIGPLRGPTYRTTPEARIFINRFDHNQPVEPFSFDAVLDGS